MKLRTKLIFYLIGLHLVFLTTSYYLFQENRLWLLAIEGFFVFSLVIGFIMIRSLFKPALPAYAAKTAGAQPPWLDR